MFSINLIYICFVVMFSMLGAMLLHTTQKPIPSIACTQRASERERGKKEQKSAKCLACAALSLVTVFASARFQCLSNMLLSLSHSFVRARRGVTTTTKYLEDLFLFLQFEIITFQPLFTFIHQDVVERCCRQARARAFFVRVLDSFFYRKHKSVDKHGNAWEYIYHLKLI